MKAKRIPNIKQIKQAEPEWTCVKCHCELGMAQLYKREKYCLKCYRLLKGLPVGTGKKVEEEEEGGS